MGRSKSYKIGDMLPVGDSGVIVEVVEYNSWNDVVIKFSNGFLTRTQMGHILRGNVKNLLAPSVAGVGFIGEGEYSATVGRKTTQEYELWSGMLRRVYDENLKKSFPTYIGVTCCEEWHNFQNFAGWFNGYGYSGEGWHLDKDLLHPKNKVYSPERCCVVPNEVNQFLLLNLSRKGSLPTGVAYRADRGTYKAMVSIGGKPKNLGTYRNPEDAFQAYVDGKRAAGKLLADKWEGLIERRVWERLLNFDVRAYL